MSNNVRGDIPTEKAGQLAELTLYSRNGCHLCEEMEGLLNDFSAGLSFTVCRINIDSDPALREKFNVTVPALYLGDREVCHHFLDLVALKAALLEITQSNSANRLE